MSESYKIQSQKTAAYYNSYQQGYNEVYGDMIQAFRPSDTDELMRTIAASAGLADGMRVLDAGCGIGGPAIWLAERFKLNILGVTISEVQVQEANENIVKKGLSNSVEVVLGDFHELRNTAERGDFDRVLFLESLGHAGEPARAIAEAYEVLKPGGAIYIKDFYYKEPNDSYWRERVQKTIANINKFYSYNTLGLIETIRALRAVGFEVDFIRKFAFKDDISIRFEFEERFGIDIFGGEAEFAPAEWLEIKCTKPNM